MKVRINTTVYVRDDEQSTNRLTEDGRIVGNLVNKIFPPMTPVDLADDEALKLLALYPGSVEVGKETADDLEMIEQLEKSRNVPRVPTQTRNGLVAADDTRLR